MISKRLTKIQKDEILEAYRGGENSNTLAEKYNCSSNTINRTVKSLLSDIEYKMLKRKRLKSNNKKLEQVHVENFEGNEEDFEKLTSFSSSQAKVSKQEQSIRNDDFYNSDFEEIAILPIGEISPTDEQNNEYSGKEKINQVPDNKFEEIAPLSSFLDFEKEKLDFEILNPENLPESVYMLVDKKVELEIKPISDLTVWSGLPENELQRNAILLFANQRSAKRSCSRSQRVIKIPDTSIFMLSKSYLIAKGITRLILEDSIIALDN